MSARIRNDSVCKSPGVQASAVRFHENSVHWRRCVVAVVTGFPGSTVTRIQLWAGGVAVVQATSGVVIDRIPVSSAAPNVEA